MLRAKTDRLSNIKNLNLWGNELENVEVLREMHNVEVLSLSVNKISSLKHFQSCTKLTELYLRKNSIHDLSEVNYLAGLKGLRVLWLWDNPCSEHPLYRPFIINTLPNLIKLDNTAITPEERQEALAKDFSDLKMIPKEEKSANGRVTPDRQARAPISVKHHHQPPPPQLEHQPHSYDIPPKESKRSGWQKRPSMPPAGHEPYKAPEVSPPPQPAVPAGSSSRNENILCAVLSLLKELDAKGLELVRRDIDRKQGRE